MRVYFKLKGDQQVTAKFGKRLPNIVRDAMGKKASVLGKKLVQYVRSRKLRGQLLKRKTGALSASVGFSVKATQQYVKIKLFAATPYAKLLERGGRIPPHMIYARGKAMRFTPKGKGKAIFAQSVNHPGATIKGRHYLGSSLKEWTPEMSRELKQAMSLALQKG